jgi:signal transduction histidine kinase
LSGAEAARNLVKAWKFEYSPLEAVKTPGSTRDEQKLWSVTCFPHPSSSIDDGRTKAGFVMYDVTSYRREVVRIEDKLMMREREVREKIDLVSTISHEVRTPLHGILGFSALLDVSPNLSQDQRDLLKAIRDCSESLQSIVSEFLDWAKLDAGKAELSMDVFDIREVVSSVGMIWKMQGTRKGLARVGVEIEDGVPGRVLGDVERIKQVLNNMLSNAVKFTPVGGTVDLRVACSGVPVPMRGGSGHYSGGGSGTMSSGSNGSAHGSGSLAPRESATYMVTFSVRDSGIGISAAGKAKLFQNYQQADTTISRRFGGTGLGLAISRGLVELMGGQMDVESSDEVGKSYSRFFMEIPLSAAAEAARTPSGTGADSLPLPDSRRSMFAMNTSAIASAQQGELADEAPLRLLVAEDNPLNQKLILRLLTKLGYRDTTIAADGKEAYDKVLEASADKPFDLVFMGWLTESG